MLEDGREPPQAPRKVEPLPLHSKSEDACYPSEEGNLRSPRNTSQGLSTTPSPATVSSGKRRNHPRQASPATPHVEGI